MPLETLKALIDGAVIEELRGEHGLWFGASTTLQSDWPPGWLLVSGRAWEGIDQVTRARAECRGRELVVACEVNVGGRIGHWQLGIALELTGSDPIELILPYIVKAGLFCTGAQFLRNNEVRLHSRIRVIEPPS